MPPPSVQQKTQVVGASNGVVRIPTTAVVSSITDSSSTIASSSPAKSSSGPVVGGLGLLGAYSDSDSGSD